jgi:hypothetical protein
MEKTVVDVGSQRFSTPFRRIGATLTGKWAFFGQSSYNPRKFANAYKHAPAGAKQHFSDSCTPERFKSWA